MNVDTTIPYRRIVATAIAAAVLTACGGGGGDDDEAAGDAAAPGSYSLAVMSDAPACGLEAVNITVAKLRFHKDRTAAADAAGWVELPIATPKKINLLDAPNVLAGATTTDLGTATLPVGLYNQMRLILQPGATANTVKVAGASAEVPLEVAAAYTGAGIALPLDTSAESGKTKGAVIAFDACNSAQRIGTAYVLKPLPRAVHATLNGIGGYIDKAILGSNITITAQLAGSIYATAVPNPATGEFRLPRIMPGNYDVVIQGRERATTVIGAVPVTAEGITAVSTAASPLTTPTSVTSSISGRITYTAPAAAPESGTWVKIGHTIAANTTVGNLATPVTYRLQPVDPATGAYTVTGLPRASIRFALYKAGVTLAPVNATTSPVAGNYRVESAVTGYAAKTPPAIGTAAAGNINVGTANATGIDIVVTQ